MKMMCGQDISSSTKYFIVQYNENKVYERSDVCVYSQTCRSLKILDKSAGRENATKFVSPIFLKNKKPTRCHLLFYCTSYRLNMFRALLYPSSGARNYDVDYHIGRFVLGLLCVGG